MKSKYWVFLIICASTLFCDQWTKHIIQENLLFYQSITVVPGFFNLTHVRNPGGAFGIFTGARGGLGSLLFVVVSLLAIAVLVVLFLRVKEGEKIHPLSYSLILSGAVGNLIDRLQYGEVIDFLDFHLFSVHWPAFNIADSAICVGIGLMAFELLVQDRKKRAK